MPTKEELKMLQALPLEAKIAKTKQRIRECVKEFGIDGVYISFSGGKDSTVLLHIARSIYPSIKAVFCDTGLEYPEIKQFVKTFSNVDFVRPKMTFAEVIKRYGYPLISKETALCVYYARKGSVWANNALKGLGKDGRPHTMKERLYKRYAPLKEVDFKISDMCCKAMKEKPLDTFNKGKAGIIATMASESKKRETAWLLTGCSIFDSNKPISKPMSFWTEQDVLRYIKDILNPPIKDLWHKAGHEHGSVRRKARKALKRIKYHKSGIASVYGDIVPSNEPEQYRFDMRDINEPLCTTGCKRTGCIFCGFGAHLEKGESRFERLKRTHPKLYDYCLGGGAYDIDGLWKPDKNGLGMKHVFDKLNEIYGAGFIRY